MTGEEHCRCIQVHELFLAVATIQDSELQGLQVYLT